MGELADRFCQGSVTPPMRFCGPMVHFLFCELSFVPHSARGLSLSWWWALGFLMGQWGGPSPIQQSQTVIAYVCGCLFWEGSEKVGKLISHFRYLFGIENEKLKNPFSSFFSRLHISFTQSFSHF